MPPVPMLPALHCLPLALLLLALPGCACGRYGTVVARRTLTPTAEVVEVYGVGALLRPWACDAGLSLGWRHATYVYPRAEDGAPAGSRWSWGFAPVRAETPFFLAARGLGLEALYYPGFLRAHAGYSADFFTFAARAEESRLADFHYRAGAPGDTRLALTDFDSHP